MRVGLLVRRIIHTRILFSLSLSWSALTAGLKLQTKKMKHLSMLIPTNNKTQYQMFSLTSIRSACTWKPDTSTCCEWKQGDELSHFYTRIKKELLQLISMTKLGINNRWWIFKKTSCFAGLIGGTLLVPPRRALVADLYKRLKVNWAEEVMKSAKHEAELLS